MSPELVEPEEPFAQRGIWRQHTGETFDHLAARHVQVEHDRGLSGLLLEPCRRGSGRYPSTPGWPGRR
ncbi:MAG: hypothetical protein ACLR8Y_06680 [Alistipes indistinctus]